jgi:hypothetical protein
MSVPDLLKYGTRGGMKWERWRDKVNIERLGDTLVMLVSGGKEATLLRAEFDRLQMWVGSARRAKCVWTHCCATNTTHTNLWSVGLWQWMMHPLHELTLSGSTAGPEYTITHGDFALQESSKLEPEGHSRLRDARYRWRVRMASELVACDGCTLLPKWWPKQSIATKDPSQWMASDNDGSGCARLPKLDTPRSYPSPCSLR